MVEIGGRPILWHIMKIYLAHGISDFVICCGYKGHVIKEYLPRLLPSQRGRHASTCGQHETLLRTPRRALEASRWWTPAKKRMTGGRMKRVATYLGDEPFCCTYGDGVGDVDITQLIAFHHKQGALATVTAVQPPGRFGASPCMGDRPGPASTKSRTATAPGSTAASSCSSPRRSTLIEGDDTRGNASRWSSWPPAGTWRHTAITASGSRWTRCATSPSLEALWEAGKAPWKKLVRTGIVQ